MPIRSLLLSALIFASSSLVASAQSPTLVAPRYVGPMGTNIKAPTFTGPQTPRNASLLPEPGTVRALGFSKKSTCYAIHSYAFKPESDTIGITRPTSESTCVVAESSTMKQAARPSSGPAFQ